MIFRNLIQGLKIGFGLLLINGVISSAQAQCPTPAFCTPGNASNPNASALRTGIDGVIINGRPFDFNGTTQGYVDRSCVDTITGFSGTQLPIRVNTGTASSAALENVRAWLDINDDGVFDNSELVFSSNNTRAHNGSIALPALSSNATYLRLRIASDLFSIAVPTFCGTPQYGQTIDLGIRVVPSLLKPVAKFSTPDTINCSGTVNFSDQSLNGPTSWFWDFGDTTTSTAQNPAKQYTRAGVYTIKLIATNSNGADTITKINYITFNDTIPAPAACTPQTVNPCCGYQLRNVVFGSLNTTLFPVSNSYQDFTCRTRTTLYLGNQYRISMTTGSQQAQDTKVWLDFNNDGNFNDTTERIFTALNTINPVGFITLPTTTTFNVPLRMRVSSDVAGISLLPCNNNVSGQTQDFTVILKQNNRPPTANFQVDSGSPCRTTFNFQFTGENVVDSLKWTFGDGSVLTTSQYAVSHTYSGPGFYNVSLKVIGPFGRDSISVDSAVIINPTPIPTTCPTSSTQPIANLGIFQLNFGGVQNITLGASQGYGDFTCSHLMRANIGQTLPISVLTGQNNIEYVRVWIDYNNNGVFEASEQAFQSSATRTHRGNITISNAAAINIPLRFRIASDGGVGGGPGGGQPNWPSACSTVRFGQIEDYTIIIDGVPQAPRANFTANRTNTCYTTISFADSSLYGPTSWSWTFGDGIGRSNDRNPTYTYTTPGTYDIKLRVSNATGEDSITKVRFITITPGNGLVTACTPSTSTPGFSVGIRGVTVNTLTKTNSAADLNLFYIDRACSDTTFLFEDTPYPMTVTTRANGNEVLMGWVDWNNNGVFETAEQFVNSSAVGNHNFILRPPVTAVQNVRLRLRLRSDFTGGGGGGGGGGNLILNPCGNLNAGHTEDYSVVVKPVTLPPLAGFITDKQNTCNGIISFTDTTRYMPNRWEWRFGDGIGTSTDRNPIYRYKTIGSFDVFLKAWNNYGVDSVTFFGAVNVTDTSSMASPICRPQSLTTQPNASIGISRVEFGSFVNASQTAGREGYRDFTCVGQIDLESGATTNGTITVSTRSAENLNGYLDMNNDGVLDNSELVFSLTGVQGARQVSVTLPATVAAGQKLLFRIMDEFNSPISSSCSNLSWGQAEDYTAFITPFGTGISKSVVRPMIAYPNPTQNLLSLVKPDKITGDWNAVVLNALGQVVLRESFTEQNNQPEIRLGGLKSGIYSLEVTDGVNRFRTKVVKE